MTHFNIQVSIQKVERPSSDPLRGRPIRNEEETVRSKTVTEILNLKLTAETEADAYAKAMRMLTASRPESSSRALLRDGDGNLIREVP